MQYSKSTCPTPDSRGSRCANGKSPRALSRMIPFVSVLLATAAAAADPAIATRLQQVLSARQQQIRAFQMDYTLSQEGLHDSRFTWLKPEYFRMEVCDDTYRWHRSYEHEKDGPISVVYSNFEGILSTFHRDKYDSGEGGSGIVGWESPPLPEGAFIDPRLALYGDKREEPIDASFPQGTWDGLKSLTGRTC